MNQAIAIVGLGCRYPDAASPAELWENVLAKRRAFRRIPDVRLNLADYYSPDPHAPDRTYGMNAAVIEDYEFDRVRFRVSGSSYRSADLAHWLALDVASQAIADAGYPDGAGLPRETTAVYVGNTLTGEFSRAATLRLRWPYVRRVVSAALAERGYGAEERGGLLRDIEQAYKKPFAEVGEETLAGGLSNTIAGRISNHFDLKGGGYTVDGACASSLLAAATACSALAAGDCDLAIAGGVDLSLDPFELVGFAKIGALAPERMRVYDARSAGFWPGEGCGFAVMMRHTDALSTGRRVYALVQGWGISSDGSGGITRPEVEGQLLALSRAYRRAKFGPDSVAYFEGHGTGTAVGDATELRVVTRARREAGATLPAAISSVKANIGHTKAAAGIAGLIKAAMAVHAQVLPAATGCETPHLEMGSLLRAPQHTEIWPADFPVRAAVSAMGFGGINVHLVMESAAAGRRSSLTAQELRLEGTPQDAELFLFHSAEQLRLAAEVAPFLSLAEMTDLAASLRGPGATRAAVVAGTPEELARLLAGLQLRGAAAPTPRIGFLFPGQGSQNTSAATEVAQPAIVRDSLGALRELRALGIEASVAVGHSLGELTALAWAGVFDEETAIRVASERGRLMAAVKGPAGAMAGIAAGEAETRRMIGGEPVVVTGLNAPRQTVISGEAEAVRRVAARARGEGYGAVVLPVSHAFHSPLMAAAAEPLAQFLAETPFGPLERQVVSTVTGAPLDGGADLRELLRAQIAAPVRFKDALQAAGPVDLWIEVGPGRVLSGLAAESVEAPALPVESGSGSKRAFLEAVGAAFELGAPVRGEALFDGRFSRPFRGRRKFFVNPCEMAPAAEESAGEPVAEPAMAVPAMTATVGSSPIEVIRELVSARSELPLQVLRDDARLLADLHLNSIVVAQIAAEAARRLGMAPPPAVLEYAGLSIAEMAKSLEESAAAPRSEEPSIPAGVDAWVRGYVIRFVPRALPVASKPAAEAGEWQFFGDVDQALRAAAWPAGGGVVLRLPANPDASHGAAMLEAAKAAVRLRRPARFVLMQQDGGAAGLARTVFMESRDLPVCVVEGTPEQAAAEAAAVRRFTEARYDAGGTRYEPVWQLAATEPCEFPLGPEDVLLVTGGGKGIGAECAIEAARKSGARLLILGTSAPGDNPNLERMRALGLRVEYRRADVTDATSIGPLPEVTAILHAAGINHPHPIEAIEETGFQRTLAVKVGGLRNILGAVDSSKLKLLVAFGSIIGRIGMAGEADYAVANEWLARGVEQFGAAQPACRCLTLEWSVWSGTGMGERLARLEALRRAGVSPISIEEGVRAFREALSSGARGTLVVTGRFGEPATAQFDAAELPLLRYLERTRVHYPGVELVCEAGLSTTSDPYLDDHVYSGARLLPGVMALEAMAQAAMAAAGSDASPSFENVRFLRPVIVPADGSLTIRLAALVRAPGEIEVCIRSAETGFQAEHFRATCRFGAAHSDPSLALAKDPHAAALDPARHLYGGLLFQEGRFRRLRSYSRLRAAECIAEAAAGRQSGWFSRYLPQTLVLGDPGVRDAAIHAIQACIPHARVLPGGAAAVWSRPHAVPESYEIRARERRREGDLLVYDMEIATPGGEVVERWSGMELRIVGAAALPLRWPAALLAPYLERRIGEIVPRAVVSVGLETNGQAHGFAAAGNPDVCNPDVTRRPDGKPMGNGRHVSRSHAGQLTMTVTGASEVGCDCEAVRPRPAETWRGLLGADGFALAKLMARETREPLDASATRVWSAFECMKKAGARYGLGIVLSTSGDAGAGSEGGWVVLGAGASRIATLVAPVEGFEDPLAFAVLLGPG